MPPTHNPYMPPTKKNEDRKIRIEMYVPMTTFKRLLLWGWIKGQSRAELCANTIAARAESNEAQFMADLGKRAKDNGVSVGDLERQIYEQAGLKFNGDPD